MKQNNLKASFVLGITGGMGSGKSTITQILKNKENVEVVDGDILAREMVQKPEVLKVLVKSFGEDILDQEGRLNRGRLADIVFNGGQDQVRALNQIMHKPIGLEIKRRVREMKSKIVLVDVALPVYEGFVDTCDQIWCVLSKREKRVQRILERDGLDVSRVNKRMGFQPSEEDYKSISDKVILNDGTLKDLENKVESLWDELTFL
jgi:dephospho-CoA kinase